MTSTQRILALVSALACLLVTVQAPHTAQGGPAATPEAARTATQPKQEKFEAYRSAILKEHGIDVRNFKGKLKGGRADKKDITSFDLNQLLMGIKVEVEHTGDKMLALEIATDHLEEIPDYYTRLERMEQEAEKELEAAKKK